MVISSFHAMYHGPIIDSIPRERVASSWCRLVSVPVVASFFGLLLASLLLGCAPSLREEATYAIARRDYPKAVERLEMHLRREPGDERARCELLQLYGAVHETEKAERKIEELETKRLVRSAHLFALGRAYEFEHAFDRALSVYGRAVERFGTQGEVLRDAGFRAARLNDGAKAVMWLEGARRLGQRDAELLHALALSLASTGDFPRALETYRACESDPDFGQACTRGIASVGLRTRDHALALAAYEKILQAPPKEGVSGNGSSIDGGAVLGATWALIELGRYDEAKKRLFEFQRLPSSRRHRAQVEKQIAEVARREASPP